MFTLRKSKEPTDLEDAISRIMFELNENEIGSEEYALRLGYLERLTALTPDTRRKPVSTDTLVSSAANLFGIALIVGWEQKHVITSKALGLLKKSG